MPKLPRVLVKQFGATGASTNFGQFGSKTAAAPQTSQNPAVIMQLARWGLGWTAAAVGAAFNPYLEDMNGFCLAAFYFLANVFERGIPDYDATTTYFLGAVVQNPNGNGQQFRSLTDNNLGNALPVSASNAQWFWQNPPIIINSGVTLNRIPKISSVTPATAADSNLLDDGVNVKTFLPLKFPDNTVQTTAAPPSLVSTQTDVTGVRALGIVYQNTTGKTMFIAVATTGTNANAIGYTDANPAPATLVAQQYNNGAGGSAGIFFIVLPGSYYKVTAPGGGGLTSWIEWH